MSREQTEEAQLFILGNTVFTLHHELGHALIDQLDLPVLGREEDAVDHLATIMMLPVQAEPVMDRLIVAAADGWAFGNARRNADGDGAVAWWGEQNRGELW
jgi:hypothetical protein